MARDDPDQSTSVELQTPASPPHRGSVSRRSGQQTIKDVDTPPTLPLGAAAAANDPSGPTSLSPQTFVLVLSLTLSVFLVALDTTILSTAIPAITNHFQSLNDIGWYASSYSLTTAVFQLLFGRFYTIFNVKWTFLTAIMIFECGSAVCGAAPSSFAFILGRSLAGVGSAGIFAGAMIVIAQTIPLRWRSLYNGIFGALYGVASVIGPPMGGIFTDKLSWRWCFYINLPIGAVTIVALVWFFNPEPISTTAEDEDATKKWRLLLRKLDLPSSASMIAAVICLLLALQWGGTQYAWGSVRIVSLLVVSTLATGLFIYIQVRRANEAFLPLRILKQRTIAGCCWFAFAGGSSFVVLLYYLPVWFQAIKGSTALESGFMNLSLVLSLVGASLLSGAVVPFVGYTTPFLIASSALRAIGAGLLTSLRPDSGPSEWASYQVIYGLGDGCGMQLPLVACQTVLAARDVPMGISVLIFVQTLGGAIFVAMAQAVFQSRLVYELHSRAPQVDANIVVASGATAFRTKLSSEQVALVLPAYNAALTRTLVISLVMAIVSLAGSGAVEWNKVKGTKQRTGSVVR